MILLVLYIAYLSSILKLVDNSCEIFIENFTRSISRAILGIFILLSFLVLDFKQNLILVTILLGYAYCIWRSLSHCGCAFARINNAYLEKIRLSICLSCIIVFVNLAIAIVK